MSTILGLDIGSNSVGWALVDTAKQTILGMGVRIFPESVNEKNTEREQSKNVERRLARQLRRQYERRRMRTDAVRGILFKAGLLPTDPSQFSALLHWDPYQLRAKALTSQLEPHEIGRIIDHINSRRGYQSNRKATSEEEESGAIYDGTADGAKPGISATDSALNPSLRRYREYEQVRSRVLDSLPDISEGYRTLGEYLASLDPHEQRRRNRFTLRDHYRIELDLILEIQSRFNEKLLPRELREKIINKVFFQRPLKSVRHLVGNCQFVPGKKRCHRSHPLFQRFRLLQQVNALRIQSTDRVDDDSMKLTATERQALIHYAEQSDKKSIPLTKPEHLKKVFGWKKRDDAAKTNLEEINPPTTMRRLYDVLGRTYVDNLSDDELHNLWNVLQFAEDVDWTTNWALKNLNVDETTAAKFARIKLEEGYGNLSLRAVKKILPFLKEGYLYHEAVVAAKYKFSGDEEQVTVGDRIPALAQEDARNPIVQRSFAEMRRVVNAIVGKWGNPDVIRVEMAREVRLPATKRAELLKANKRNRSQNESDRERLKKEFRLDAPSRHDLLKLRLWEEQSYVCIYTGRQISRTMLFDGSVDVDHILPYSRTLDDGRENKVLCLREVNQKKGDRTPVEAAQAGIIDLDEYRERVAALYKNHKITPAKQRKLLMTPEVFAERFTSGAEDGFVARQLNDTRFASRLALKYLHHVAPRVEATTGQLTAMLRHHWGLDGVLPELASLGRAWISPIGEPGRKDRHDHRHHAIDALTVALTDRSLVHRLATLNARTGNAAANVRDGKIIVPDAPIAGLRKLALDAVDSIIVSHRKTRPGRGALHAETLYGLARDRNGEQLHNDRGVPMYKVRKPLSSLSPGEMLNIVDKTVRDLVLQRLREVGVDVETDNFTIPKDAFLKPLYMHLGNGQRRQIKRVRVYKPSGGMVRLRENGVYVEPSGNDHIRLWSSPELGKPMWEVRTLYEEVRGLPEKVTSPPAADETQLRIGDLVDFPNRGVYKVQKMSGAGRGEVAFYHHADASGDVKHLLRLSPSTVSGKKLFVDYIGEIHDR